MGVHQQPDPAKQIADITGRLDKIESIVRRGKPAPNMRDLTDADLTKVADGEVPVYDSSTGRWVPGSAGGAPPTAYFGLTGTSFADQIAGGTNLELYEEYNYGGLFTLEPVDNETILIARDCIVRVEAWFRLTSGPAGKVFLELKHVEPDLPTAEIESALGGAMALGVAFTYKWSALDDLRMHAYHSDTGSTYSANAGALIVTYVRDA